MSSDKPTTASAVAHAIVELLPDSQPARHLLTAVNRYSAIALAADVENDHALNMAQLGLGSDNLGFSCADMVQRANRDATLAGLRG